MDVLFSRVLIDSYIRHGQFVSLITCYNGTLKKSKNLKQILKPYHYLNLLIKQCFWSVEKNRK